MRTLILTAAILGMTLLTPGCIKLKDRTMLLPDGSGKLAMRVGMSSEALKMAANLSEDESYDFAAAQLVELRNDWEGFTAFTRPVKSVDGDWTWVSFEAYFDDLNAVKVWKKALGSGERELQKTFELERTDDGGMELTFTHKVLTDLTGRFAGLAAKSKGEMTEEERAKFDRDREMFRSAFEGLELDFAVEMPADVTRASGFTRTTGGTSTLRVTLDDLCDADKAEKMGKIESLVVRCGPAKWAESDLADFREERDEAIAAWKTLLAELEEAERETPADGE